MEIAYRHRIKGFVRNKSDGSVYIEAEGTEENLTKFLEWCKRGPVWARIQNISESAGVVKDYNSFEIVR